MAQPCTCEDRLSPILIPCLYSQSWQLELKRKKRPKQASFLLKKKKITVFPYSYQRQNKASSSMVKVKNAYLSHAVPFSFQGRQ